MTKGNKFEGEIKEINSSYNNKCHYTNNNKKNKNDSSRTITDRLI